MLSGKFLSFIPANPSLPVKTTPDIGHHVRHPYLIAGHSRKMIFFFQELMVLFADPVGF